MSVHMAESWKTSCALKVGACVLITKLYSILLVISVLLHHFTALTVSKVVYKITVYGFGVSWLGMHLTKSYVCMVHW